MSNQLLISKEELKELQKFNRLYGEEESKEVADFFSKICLHAYLNSNKDVKYFVKKLNEIKEQNANFHLSRERLCGQISSYNSYEDIIYVNKEHINKHDETIFFHEVMHLIHKYSSLHSNPPIDYAEKRNRALDNMHINIESIMSTTSAINEKYQSILKKARDYVYDNYILKAGASSVADYIEKEEGKYRELAKKKGIYDELIEMGMNHQNAVVINSKSFEQKLTTYELLNTLIQQIYKDKIDLYSFELSKGETAYESFIDALLKGEHEEKLLIHYGHTKEYFEKSEGIDFQEVLATYSEIKNSEEGMKWIELLKNQVGSDFMEYIEEIYSQVLNKPFSKELKEEDLLTL